MKNIFKTSILIIAFALGGILFQISCSNSDDTSSPAETSKILFTKTTGTTHTLWYCGLDGSNPTQIPFTLPANVIFQWNNANTFARFTPDGQKVVFVAINYTLANNEIYSVNLDGSNLQLLLSQSDANQVLIGDIK